MAEMQAEGKKPEYLFWVGCAGSFDTRAQKVTAALCKILHHAEISYAVLGNEENCTGDPARRSGNEFLFQMSAIQNIETLNMYEVKKIITICPHCFNTLQNEYPALGGNYEVIHHTQMIESLIKEKKITIEGGAFEGRSITYHDSCYLGRINGIYEAPRTILNELDGDIKEMKENRSKGLCCGAGGAQAFKEEEEGTTSVSNKRTEQILETGSSIVAANCPYCIMMLTDGLKNKNKEEEVSIYDISELVIQSNNW